jgi:hypothetical protein
VALYPLHEILVIQQDFHSLVDQSYLLTGKKRVARSDRLQYALLASQPQEGSFLQAFDLVVKAVESAAPLAPLFPYIAPNVPPVLTQIGGSEVWKNAKAAFDLLKKILSLRKEGTVPNVIQNNKGDVIIASGSAQITVNKVIFDTANRSERFYKALADKIESGRVEEIKALDDKEDGIRIGRAEKALFTGESQMGKEVEITGKIFDFNTETRVGRIKVAKEQPLPEADYYFHLFGEQSTLPYIVAMTVEAVKVRCVPESVIKTTGLDLVSRLWSMEVILPKGFSFGPLFS